MAPLYDPVVGDNPPYGASIHYWLKSAGKDTLKDSVSIGILDSSDAVVRTVKGPMKAGVNRVWWDLRFENSKQARLRATPEDAPWLPIPADTGRPAPGVGRYAILAPPGTYTVRLAMGGQEQKQPLVLRKDPNSGASEADIRAQTELARAVQADLNDVVGMINAVEGARGQVASIKSTLGTDSSRADVRAAADSLDRKMIATERILLQTRVTGRGQDQVRWPMRLAEQLVYLAQEVGDSDFGPTASQREVQQLLHEQARAAHTQVDQLLQREVAQFNDMLRKRKLQTLITVGQ
jgi:hypothetical protein